MGLAGVCPNNAIMHVINFYYGLDLVVWGLFFWLKKWILEAKCDG